MARRTATSRRPRAARGVAPDEIELEGELDDPSAGHFEGVTTVKREPTLNDFTLMQVLGKRSFGKVVLAKRVTSGRIYAMKIAAAQLVRAKQIERTKTERRVLQAIDHPFIMRLHYAFQVRSARKRGRAISGKALTRTRPPPHLHRRRISSTSCSTTRPGGELFFHLSRFRRFPEHVARFYAAELALAIGFLHSRSIIYRDMKPENVRGSAPRARARQPTVTLARAFSRDRCCSIPRDTSNWAISGWPRMASPKRPREPSPSAERPNTWRPKCSTSWVTASRSIGGGWV